MSATGQKCCVPGCLSRRFDPVRNKAISFHRFPNTQVQIAFQRRRLWIQAVFGEADRPVGTWAHICGRHFVTGKPAKFNESGEPNWIPTLHLNHEKEVPDVKPGQGISYGEDGAPEPEQVILTEQRILRLVQRVEADPFREDLQIKEEVEELDVKPDVDALNEAIANEECDNSMSQSEEIFFDDSVRCLFCLNELSQAEKHIVDFNKENTFKAQIEYVLARCIEFPNYPCCKNCKHMIVLFYDFKKSCLIALENAQELVKYAAKEKPPVNLQIRSAPKRKPEPTTSIAPKKIKLNRNESMPEANSKEQKDSPEDGYIEERMRCKNCGQMFDEIFELTLHKEACLPPKEPLKCQLCPAELKTDWELQLHQNRHNGVTPFPCRTKDCPKAFPSPVTRIFHEKKCRIASPKVVCPICGVAFKVDIYLKRHMVKHEAPRFECAVCHWKFGDLNTFRGHMMRHFERNEKPKEPNPDDTLDFKCDSCVEAFATPELLNGHKVYCGKNEKFRKFQLLCPHCPESFNKQETFDQHLNRHKGIRSIPCRKGCSKMFLDIPGRNSHELYRCGTDGANVCPICQVALDTPAALGIHMKAHRKATAVTS